jgi:SpoIIAA-like
LLTVTVKHCHTADKGYPMGVIVTKESESKFVIRVNGILTFNDQKGIENRLSAEIDKSSKVKMLVLTENFSGWSKEGDWGDLSFMNDYDPYIEKIAVVADKKWRDQILMFTGAGLRQASLKFFSSRKEEIARDWLQDKNE